MSFVSTHYGGVHTKELSIDDLTNVIGGAPEGEVLNTYYPPERSPMRKYAALIVAVACCARSAYYLVTIILQANL